MEIFLTTIISILLTAMFATNGYFLRKIFEKVEKIEADIADIKPKVNMLWNDRYAKP